MFKQVAGALCAISLVACSGGQAADEAPETAALVIGSLAIALPAGVRWSSKRCMCRTRTPTAIS